MSYCDECASEHCTDPHENCEECGGDICGECCGCDCPDAECPGYVAHHQGH
ncbi:MULTISPECIES: hypothetical protein [unclassified Kitasatospora]|uniref:hypothetical protein n=1 Tax=unclassified Kitasatospora TaxID=2633591 RepID=UPI000A77351C|nr:MULTISPECIES: hypothetical protein [unclassified Kitasatospora]